MALLFLLAPSTQVKRLYSRNEKEQERLQDCSLLSVFEISFWSVIKMIKRWAAGEMAPWSLDHPAPSYPPQQCMHGEDAGGYQSPVGQLAGTARSTFRGKPCLKNMVEMYWGRLPMLASHLHRLTPVRAPLHTHSTSCVLTNDPNLTPTTCYVSTYHSVLFVHWTFALCTQQVWKLLDSSQVKMSAGIH